jgi:hypothetical protein
MTIVLDLSVLDMSHYPMCFVNMPVHSIKPYIYKIVPIGAYMSILALLTGKYEPYGPDELPETDIKDTTKPVLRQWNYFPLTPFCQ